MHTFEIWSPVAKKICVQVDGTAVPMQGPDERGWWRVDVADAHAGSKYGFLIDDDAKAYPDPRSLWQPDGVHGLSRVYDHAAFQWSDKEFRATPLASAIFYELHVGTFTPKGTLDAAIEKLEYLKDLGVTHVELMPVAAFDGEHGWGYDGVALFAVHAPYGGPDALKRFVDAAHAKGLAVILDVVYNHFGPSGNYTGQFGPYTTDAHHTPWGGAVNLEDAWSAEVRRFFCDNALMWMRDFHCDGLRLDAVHAYVDRSATHFLEQLAMETDALEAALGRPLVLIAESDLNDPRIVSAREAGGYGIDAQWSDDFHHALFTVLARERQGGYYADFGELAQLAKALERTFVYEGQYSIYRRRHHGRTAAHLPQNRFFGYIQNHDQVGNRAIGDRVHECAGFDRAKIAAAVVLTAPFVPLIFQGEEWAASSPFQFFADHQDPDLARAVSAGRKREFQAFGWDPAQIPDPEKRETFERSKLKWEELGEAAHSEMLAWYRALIALRRSSPDLRNSEPGHTQVDFDARERWLVVYRGELRILCNLGPEARTFELAAGASVLLASQSGIGATGSTITLPPDSVAVTGGSPGPRV
ncbi:MAG: malto-oligosyltrehalose trehalohydrolase [Acidobacteriota bacterium]